jgi:hypothetical protein
LDPSDPIGPHGRPWPAASSGRSARHCSPCSNIDSSSTSPARQPPPPLLHSLRSSFAPPADDDHQDELYVTCASASAKRAASCEVVLYCSHKRGWYKYTDVCRHRGKPTCLCLLKITGSKQKQQAVHPYLHQLTALIKTTEIYILAGITTTSDVEFDSVQGVLSRKAAVIRPSCIGCNLNN